MPTNMPPTARIMGNSLFPAGDGEAPMTDEQAARLRELAQAAGEPMDAELTRHQAARRIAALEEILRGCRKAAKANGGEGAARGLSKPAAGV